MSPISPAVTAEVFTIPVEAGKYIVYAPLRRAAFVANSAAVRFVRDLQAGVFREAADPKGALVMLLRALQIVDAGPEPRPVTRHPEIPAPTSVTLLLTTACNLRCTYCYAATGDSAVESMTTGTARRGIDFVAANAAKLGAPCFEVNFHGGGEPTLNWRVLTGAFEHARRRALKDGLQLHSSLTTNGVIPDKKLDWVIANLENLTISCDGLPAVHDRCRPQASGRGSSARVTHTLSRLDKAGVAHHIRLTVTAEHVASLPESVDFLCARFRPQSIQVEPVYLLGRGAGDRSAESDAFIEAFRAARRRAADRGIEVIFSGARLGTLTSHFCGVSQDGFCLSAQGNVTACYEAFSETCRHASVFFYGHPAPGKTGYAFDPVVLERLRAQSVENRPHCRTCFARWSCGGDCYYKWLAASGGGEFSGSARCHVIRELTKDQILEKIARSGGLFWHDPPPGR